MRYIIKNIEFTSDGTIARKFYSICENEEEMERIMKAKTGAFYSVSCLGPALELPFSIKLKLEEADD